MNTSENPNASKNYDAEYFNWQKDIGVFGGWANAHIFADSISRSDTVVDFGCGGGFLLKNLACKKPIGIEPNPTARASVEKLQIACFPSPQDALDNLGEGIADVIISTNALEHTLNPLQEIIMLKRLLRIGGAIHFVVPCDSIHYKYNPQDKNYHLYSWSPQNLGNLFTEAGYEVEYSRPFVHKWPPFYRQIARLGWPIFNLACLTYGRIERSWFQVELRAKKTLPVVRSN
jgi:SAM-dependent methyltransferase